MSPYYVFFVKVFLPKRLNEITLYLYYMHTPAIIIED